jgi:TetR/AcrR family transcriptional repressor of nem operon
MIVCAIFAVKPQFAKEAGVKVTKEKAAQNRAALVEAAGRLFRERGIDGVGVAEISKEAGLTHGALYAQFASKEDLAAEALACGLQRGNRQLAVVAGGASTLTDQLDHYLSVQHRDSLAGGCAMAASASEIARQGDAVSARYSEGFAQLVGIVESTLGNCASKAGRRQRALAIVAAMIGGVAVARATAKSRPELSAEVLKAARRVLGEVGGEPARPAIRKAPTTVKR